MWQKLSDFIFGEPVRQEMPARVIQQIETRQCVSERLISWVQFILIVLFGALWVASQQVNMNDTAFQVVPFALAAYFVFTMTRLVLSYRIALPHWLLTLSVLMDIALLMLLIWSFHIQYEQPASFYLKAPTIMYVFIFIALRALRFEPRYIMITGLAAIAGWGVLVGYVMVAEAGNPMITRNYITYLTSNAILVGAEIDKMVSIFLVTVVLCIVVVRARRAFFRAVLEQTAAEDLSRFVSKEVAARITSSDRQIQPGDGECREATIIFTDIEGFSGVSENMTAPELAKTLNEYFGAMGEVIDRHGGVITLFEGDLMLITFNAIKDDPDHALNAIRTALEIEEVARTRTFNGAVLKTRCGINTGEINVGAVGAQDRLVFTVHGDNVNIAARLEQLNKQYGTYIMMGEATHLAVHTDYPCKLICEAPVKGRTQPVKVYAPAERA
ncbi:adenylate/guanylate cyclase domain-containing protein [Thalassospiraceae bacterium LMO-JJ14]|nr:adenylate/guanylate cyclase domain-containing protein [Thalassospiraceae bacterium LMO-JJ14]